MLGGSYVAPRRAAPVARSPLRSLRGRLVRSFLATSGRPFVLFAARDLPPPGIPFGRRWRSSLPEGFGTGYGFGPFLLASLRARSPAPSSRFRGLTTVLNAYKNKVL